MRYIDLRSDTVTKPSEEMRRAIATAEVGDDVFNDDQTVIQLEKIVAELFGREAALFVPSGTMGNQVCLKTISDPGDEIICEEGAHIFNYEVAAAAAFSGLLFHVIKGVRGVITAAEIRPLVRPIDIHSPRTKIIAIENTHNRAGGTIFPLEEMEAIRNLADETGSTRASGWRPHLECAYCHRHSADRVWSSCRHAERLSYPKDWARRSVRWSSVISSLSRKLAGCARCSEGVCDRSALSPRRGSMRSSTISSGLAEDHDNAWYLAETLSEIDGIYIDLDSVQTNIVVIDIAQSGRPVSEVLGAFKEKGLLAVQLSALPKSAASLILMSTAKTATTRSRYSTKSLRVSRAIHVGHNRFRFSDSLSCTVCMADAVTYGEFCLRPGPGDQ